MLNINPFAFLLGWMWGSSDNSDIDYKGLNIRQLEKEISTAKFVQFPKKHNWEDIKFMEKVEVVYEGLRPKKSYYTNRAETVIKQLAEKNAITLDEWIILHEAMYKAEDK